MKAAATAAEYFLHGAAEIDVDHVEATFDQPDRGRPELFRIGAHELTAGRMLFLRDVQEMTIPPARLELDDEFVEHHFANRIRSAESPSDHTHRHVAVARERRLHDRKVELQRTESKLRSG